MPPEAASVFSVIRDITLAGLLALILVGGYREMWYYGPYVRREMKRWQDEHDRLLGVIEKLSAATDKSTRAASAALTVATSRKKGDVAND
jgi:hypothetical protein